METSRQETKTIVLLLVFALLTALLAGCRGRDERRVVLCVPVYGQSLALGEEAPLTTAVDSLSACYDGRIVGADFTTRFGYFDLIRERQQLKQALGYRKRSHELSVYQMADCLASELGRDTLLCIFCGGKGATPIAGLGRGTVPYSRFLSDISRASHQARLRGLRFEVPAVCFLQGESDIDRYTDTDYFEALRQLSRDLNRDIRAITGQGSDVVVVCYQTNNVTNGSRFDSCSVAPVEAHVPMAQLLLVRDDSLFAASSPTYFYTFARERIHLDAASQQLLGRYEARTVLDLVRRRDHRRGLVPVAVHRRGSDVVVRFHVPRPPLLFDTLSVAPVPCYGFRVVSPDGQTLSCSAIVAGDSVTIGCCAVPPSGSHLHYAIGGEPYRSGRDRGPRGNLRDSDLSHSGEPLPNWAYQFDLEIPSASY